MGSPRSGLVRECRRSRSMLGGICWWCCWLSDGLARSAPWGLSGCGRPCAVCRAVADCRPCQGARFPGSDPSMSTQLNTVRESSRRHGEKVLVGKGGLARGRGGGDCRGQASLRTPPVVAYRDQSDALGEKRRGLLIKTMTMKSCSPEEIWGTRAGIWRFLQSFQGRGRGRGRGQGP